MNKSDSERIAGFLESLGGRAVDGPEEADLVILNTCSVRQSAEDRVFGQVHNLVELKKTKPDLIIAVTGCLPGRDKDGSLRKKMLGLDLYFPIIDLPRLPEMLAKINNIQYPISNIKDGGNRDSDYLKIRPLYNSAHSAFVPIQTGCNNYCSYCVVPYARGPERNRPLQQILTEAKDLAESGCLEITLLGQVVNNYQAPDPENFSPANPFYPRLIKGDSISCPPLEFIPTEASGKGGIKGGLANHFAALLWEINQIEGLNRIHFTAPDPQFMSDEVIEALTLPKQVNYLHLPVQSGSNKILKKMNRRYTREDYLDIIQKIKKKKPAIALGTDIMVGFPGETEKDFQATVDLYKQVDFDIAYLAQYSPRSGTAAFRLPDNVSPEEKEKRWRVLQKLMEETALRKNQGYAGKVTEVLIDKTLKTLKGKETIVNRGQSREMKLVEFESDRDWLGKIVKVKIAKAEEWRLCGKKT